MPHALTHTVHVPSGPGPFPTLLLLHGWGASAHDLFGLAPLLKGGELLVLCPQGEIEIPIGPRATGYGWFPLVPGQPPEPEDFARHAATLREFVAEAIARYPIDPARLAVGGFSQGGVMAFELALSAPERFRGLAALSSWLPPPLAEAIGPREGHAELPVLVTHGTRDPLIEIERARATREALRGLGVALTYREFEMAHEIRQEALEVFDRWLGERVFPG